jgi:hypothetical protein
VCIEGRIVYLYDSINYSQFICAEETSDNFYEPLKNLLAVKFWSIIL